MALLLPSVVIVLVVVRLLIPPVPGLLKIGMERWGKFTTIMLCAVSLIGAALAIALSRH
jgi:hypothetical protein